MKKLMTIMLVVILSCNFVLCAYADEPKRKMSFMMKVLAATKRFTLTV